MRKSFIHKTGFTLIELMVVIAIIALIASLIFSFLGSARDKAIVSKNIQSLRELRNALELYINQTGSAPTASYDPVSGNGSVAADNNGATSLNTVLQPLVAAGFISKIPTVANYPNNSCTTSDCEYFHYNTIQRTTIAGIPLTFMCGDKPVTSYALIYHSLKPGITLQKYIAKNANGTITFGSQHDYCFSS